MRELFVSWVYPEREGPGVPEGLLEVTAYRSPL
jgi:hypothetical protein